MQFNIFDLLLPRETKFYKYLSEQTTNLLDGSVYFKDTVDSLEKLSNEELLKRIAEMKDFERKGDDIERKIIDALDKTFITPLDREDIHQMAMGIDHSLDMLNNLARKLEIYGVTTAPNAICGFCNIIVEAAKELNNLMAALPKRDGAMEIIRVIHSIERRGDDLFHHAMADLFKGEHSPIDVIKFKEIFELLEEITDSIDHVAKQIRGVLVKVG